MDPTTLIGAMVAVFAVGWASGLIIGGVVTSLMNITDTVSRF